jgi:3-oxoacyl-[acyl-carrier protein] reductase
MAETDLLKQVTPEFIATIKAKIPMGRFVKIEEVAAMVAWIASSECSFTTGFTFDLSGGRATY